MTNGGASRIVDLGNRISQARAEAGMTQTQLGQAVGLDRTAIAKLEAGTRKVAAMELVAIAAALDRPIDWFVVESSQAVLSRRSHPSVEGQSRVLDIKIDRLARDIRFLVEEGIITDPSERLSIELPSDVADAEAAAEQVRNEMSAAPGPLYDLQRASEKVNLLAFSLKIGENGGDAAYVEVGNLGVALINGSMDPGRRRFNLAHELGHHIFGDAYAPEIAVGSGNEVERIISAFAIHLILPREAVSAMWLEKVDHGTRLAAVAIAVSFRASWSATCNQLCNLHLIDAATREQLMVAPPSAADFIALGERWIAELEAPALPPEYGIRVLGAYQAGKLSKARTVELLWGTVTIEDLPEQHSLPLEPLHREFDQL